MNLEPCTSCGRHVLTTAPSCPFCEAPLTPSAKTQSRPPANMGRAALMAFMTLAACQDPPSPGPNRPAPTPNTPVASSVPAATETGTTAPTPTPTQTSSAAPTASATTTAAEAPVVKDAGTTATKDAGPKVVTTATTTHRNLAKPYGAPPADGLRIT